METKLSQFRKQYPQYNNRSDDELLKALHQKYYPDREYDDYLQRMTTPLPGADEGVNPDTGQPWTREEIEATKITPDEGYGQPGPRSVSPGPDMNPERAYEDFQGPESRLEAGDYGKTLQAGAAKVASNRLNEMEAERRKHFEEVVAFRVKQEGEENRAKIEGETRARLNQYGTGTFYDAFIRPFFSKGDKTPGERITDWADNKLRSRSEVAQRKGEKPFVSRDAKWHSPETWFDGTTVFSDPEAFFLKIAENAPQIGVSYGSAMVGGKAGALRSIKNLGSKARSNPALVRETVEKAAKRGGMVAGGATEYVLIRDAVGNETRERILQLPDEQFFEYPGFDDMVDEVGMARAKQMVADEKARHAGMVAAPLSAVLGAPASGLIGRIGAGAATTGGSALSRIVKGGTKAALMEAPTEGTQEVIENIAGNIGVSMVNPEQAWTEGSLNAFFGGAAIGGAFGGATGVLGGLAPETGQTKDTRGLMADEKTRTYLEAARDREKVQAKMSDTDSIMKMSVRDRLKNWEELEALEEKEARLMLKAEPGLRRNILKREMDPEGEKRAFHLLDTLTAKSRATLKQIEMMRRERSSEDALSKQVEQQEKARQEIGRRIERDMNSLQEYEEMSAAIEEVQQGGVIDPAMYDQLAERGYGRWADKQKSDFTITKKGQSALPEMRRQIDQLTQNLETQYTGPERRKDLGRRERIAQMTPEEIEKELYREPNTKLKNRRAYQEDEKTEPAEAVAVVDADSLKWVNDNMGHPKGDYLLRKIARALRAEAGDRAYHLSGDEFVVTGDSAEEVEQVLEAAEARLAGLRPIEAEGQSVQPSMSWGVAETLEDADRVMKGSKAKRQAEGKRAARGEAPPTLTETEGETTTEEAPADVINIRDGGGLALKGFGKAGRRATKNQMRRARRMAYSMTEGFRNLPKGFIKLVNTVDDLPRNVQDQLRSMGAGMNSVKGMFDEQNPRNGIYVIVANIKPKKDESGWVFERDVAEVVMHEMVGHYGLRGLLGSQAQLDETMDAIIAAFPELTHRIAKKYGYLPTLNKHRAAILRERGIKLENSTPAQRASVDREAMTRAFKQVDPAAQRISAEELVAHMAGDILSKRVTLNKQQKSAWRRLMETIRQWLIDHGYGRFARGPLAFKDADLLELIQRSQDFIRHQNNWSFQRDSGESVSPYLFMKDSEIYISRLKQAFTKTRVLTKNERKQRGGLPAGTTVPLLKDSMNREQWVKALDNLQKQGEFSAKEVEWSGIREWLTGDAFTWGRLTEFNAMPFEELRRMMRNVAQWDETTAQAVKEIDTAMAMLQEDMPTDKQQEHYQAVSTINFNLNRLVPKQTKFPKSVVAEYVEANNLSVMVRPPNGYRFNEQLIFNWVKSRNSDKPDEWIRAETTRTKNDWAKNGPPFGDPAFVNTGGLGLQQGSMEIPWEPRLPETGKTVTKVTVSPKSHEITLKIDRRKISGQIWPQGQPVITLQGQFEWYDSKLEATKAKRLPTSAWVTKVTEDEITFAPLTSDEYWDTDAIQALSEQEEITVTDGEMSIPYMVFTNTEYEGNRSYGVIPETYREYLLRFEGKVDDLYAGGHWRSNTYGQNSFMHLRSGMVYDANPGPYLSAIGKGKAYFLNEIQSDWLQAYAKTIPARERDALARERSDMMDASKKFAQQMHDATTFALKSSFDQMMEADMDRMVTIEKDEGPEASWDAMRSLMYETMTSMETAAREQLDTYLKRDRIGKVSVTNLNSVISEYIPKSDVRMMDLLHLEAMRFYVENDLQNALSRARSAVQNLSNIDIRNYTREPEWSAKFEKAGRVSAKPIAEFIAQRAWENFESNRTTFSSKGNQRAARLPYLRKVWEEVVEATASANGRLDPAPVMEGLRRRFDNMENTSETIVTIPHSIPLSGALGPEIANRLMEFYEPQMNHDFPDMLKFEEMSNHNAEKHLKFIATPEDAQRITERMKKITPYVTDEIRKAVTEEFNRQTQTRAEAEAANAAKLAQGALFDQGSAPVPPTRAERRWMPREDAGINDLNRWTLEDESDHNDFNVQDFEDFENNIDWGEEVSDYWDNFDWDGAELNGEDLDESHSAYVAIEEVQGYADAEAWLSQARDRYKDENEEQANDYVRDDLRYRFYESGEGPQVYSYKLTATDEDGDAVELRVALRRDDYAGSIDLVIERDSDGDWEDVETGNWDFDASDAGEKVLAWMQDEDLTPTTEEFMMGEEEVTVPNTPKPDATAPVPVPQVTVENPESVDWKGLAKELESNLLFDTKDVLTMDNVVERYTKAWNTLARKDASGIKEPPFNEKKAHEAAIQFLISDAIRNGTRKIMWQQGESTTKRGGASAGWTQFNSVTYAPMSYIDLTGRRNKVYRVEGSEVSYGYTHTLYVREQDMVQTMGHDVWRYMQDQMAGNKPSGMVDANGKAMGAIQEKRKEPSLDDIVVRETATGQFVAYHMNFPDTLISQAQTREALLADLQVQLEDAKEAGFWSFAESWKSAGADITEDGDTRVPEKFVIKKDDIGGYIGVSYGGTVNPYSDYAPTDTTRSTIFGARYAYGPKLESMWNSFLKKYGVKIEDMQRTVSGKQARSMGSEELGRVKSDPGGEIMAAELGRLGVVDLGNGGPYIIESEKKGMMADQLYRTQEQANDELKNIKRNFARVYGLGDPKNIATRGFIITDEMIEDAEKGWPLLSYSPYDDPVIKQAAERIGARKKPLRDRYDEMMYRWKDKFNQGMFDRFHGIKAALRRTGSGNLSAENNPYIQARLTTSLDSTMKAVMEYGHPVWREGIVQTEGTGLLEILQPVAKQLDLWGMYMAGVRAKRLMDEGREKNFTPEMIEKMVNLGEQFPVFKDVARDYAAFNQQVLDFAEEAGIINPETRPMWESADYVPFYRVQDDRLVGPLGKGKGIADVKQPIKRLKGGEDPIGDITHNILMNITQLIDSAMKNHAAKMAVDAMDGTGLVQKMPWAFSAQLVPMKQIEKLLVQHGMDPASIPDEAKKGFQSLFAMQPPKGDGVISIMRDGKKEFYFTDDQLLYEAMTAINQKQWGLWMRLLRKPKRLLTTAVTLDPGFMIRNYIRDLLSAFVIGRNPYVPFTRSAQGFKEALMKDESYRTMLSAGAAFENGYINAYDPTATQRQIRSRMKTRGIDASTVLNTPLKLFEAWKAIGSASENANRIAQYHAAIKAGKSKAQAVFESKDLMDFSMGGSWAPIQVLIQTVPFMGARLQGLHRLGRGAAEQPLSFAIKGTIVGMAGLALWFQYKDDERYAELEEWDKDVYFHFWIGEQHYRLPKPFEVGAIFNTIPERAFEFMYNEENDAGKLLMKRFGFMLGETFNFNPIPQAFMPAVESIFNYSFFTGGPITSPWEEKRMGPEQYRYYNSPTMIEVARHLPDWMDKFSDPPGKLRSPRHLQHVFSGYFGTLGKYFLMAADAVTRNAMSYPAPPERSIADMPVIGSFVRGEKQRRTKYEEEFYKLLTRTLQVKNSLSFLNKVELDERMDLLEEKYDPYVNVAKELESFRQEISKLNNEVMQIYLDPGLTPKAKREQIDSIQQEKNAVFRDAYGLRPGGRENPLKTSTTTPEDLNFMLEKFGMDELPGELQKQGNPATASLITDIVGLDKKQAGTLQ